MPNPTPPTSDGSRTGTGSTSATDRAGDDAASAVRIDRLGPGDWMRYRDLRLALLSTDGWAFGARLENEVQVAEAEWRRRISAYRVFAAVREGRDVGIAALRPIEGDPATLKLISVWVESGQRGSAHGVSDALIARCVEEARAAGVEHVLLGVKVSNVRAQRLYERHGFRAVAPPPGDPDAPTPVALEMLLDLATRP